VRPVVHLNIVIAVPPDLEPVDLAVPAASPAVLPVAGVGILQTVATPTVNTLR
jgi:hypothetical protein